MSPISTKASQLALLGGEPVVRRPIPPFNSMGPEERVAVERVLSSGCLSAFVGDWGPDFLGGPVVREFESAWASRFSVPHVVSVNSATSGLVAAVGAARVGPGDEVIVPPFSMSATAVAPLAYGAIPVFADIDPDTFCIDPEKVRAAITPRTRAVIAVNLFGHPARLSELRAIADEHRLILIEDNAQAPLAREGSRYAGTIGHIGVFSLNFHKHIHTGEGGMCVTSDAELALRLQLIRNHGENAVEAVQLGDLTNLFGFNLRMTELTAAVGLEQLKKIDANVAMRVEVAEELSAAVADLEGITAPRVRAGCSHVYYVWAFRYDESRIGVSRRRFSEALAAEGIPHGVGYVRPLYLLPLFQRRVAVGREGFPFSLGAPDYRVGTCPVAEGLHDRGLMLIEICSFDLSDGFGELAAAALQKVHSARASLADS